MVFFIDLILTIFLPSGILQFLMYQWHPFLFASTAYIFKLYILSFLEILYGTEQMLLLLNPWTWTKRHDILSIKSRWISEWIVMSRCVLLKNFLHLKNNCWFIDIVTDFNCPYLHVKWMQNLGSDGKIFGPSCKAFLILPCFLRIGQLKKIP